MSSVQPDPSFDAEARAELARKAMKGMGTNEKKLISSLTGCTNEQRQAMRQQYKVMYGRDLIDDIKSETGGSFEKTLVAMVRDPIEYDAQCLRDAMKGAGTDESVISEILASRSADRIQEIKAKYSEMFSRDLEKDLQSETSGHLRRLYTSLVQPGRPYDSPDEPDLGKAEADAQALKDAGEKSWGTDESEFNRVLMTSSRAQISALSEEYRKISDYDLIRVIEKEMSGDLEFAFKSVVICARKPAEYFAERLYKAMKGAGTEEDTLVRVIVSRSEVDLQDIKATFLDRYNKHLAKMVKDDIGGDFERALLAVIGDD